MENVLQRTDDWFQKRCGKVTASKISCVMAKGKSGAESKTRLTYLREKVLETITNKPFKGYKSDAMERGEELEDDAKAAYSFEHGVEVVNIDFVNHPRIKLAGASPDGLIGDDGLIEVKCPEFNKHYETLRTGKIDRVYLLQMQYQMACTGRQWCDYVSYNPDFGIEKQLFITRVMRDDALIAEIESEVEAFLEELQAELDWWEGK